MGQVFSINSVFDFEKRCLDAHKKILKWITDKQKIETPGDVIRPRLLAFYKHLIELYIGNSEFIVESIQKDSNLEPAGNIIRTIIELYCRAMYLNNVDEKEKIKKIIGIDLYTITLLNINTPASKYITDIDLKIAKSLNITLPTIKELQEWIKEGIIDLRKSKELNDFRNNFFFSSVKKIVRNYLNEAEEPRIPKSFLYKYYLVLSDQIHGNPYLGQDKPTLSPRNRILGLLIVIHLRFLKEVSTLTNFPMEEFNSLVETWKKDLLRNFLDLWKFTELLF
ncbi:MAG: hypothetical protein Q8N71_04815 [candidate division Zixibacteria bacterium]|nr:hypothetical protein [candidate division Zixibacteria bacterium]